MLGQRQAVAILNTTNISPNSEASWHSALAALRQHQVIGFPTETVWGLGADAASEQAVVTLNALKGRDAVKALQVSCLSVEQALGLARSEQPLLQRLSGFLPGPLTLVAWAAPHCPPWLQKEGKVGLRVPQHPLTQELLRRFGGPLATTSFNPTGLEPALNHAQAARYGLVSVLLEASQEGGHQASSLGLPSTVIDCTTGLILREGALLPEVRHALKETSL